jgi:hypothetical protein
MMGQDPGDIPQLEVAAGSLTNDKFLGFSLSSLEAEEGRAVPKLALVGSLIVLIGFFIPVAPGFGESMPAWKAFDEVSSIALIFPALAALFGLVAAFGPLLNWQRSVLLIISGTIGLGTLPFLGGLSGSPDKFMPVLIVAGVVASWGFLIRCFDAQSDLARRTLIVAAVLTLIGFFIPMSNADNAIPVELRFYLAEEIDKASPFHVFKTVFNRDPMVFFSTVLLFLPLVLVPVGAALSWAKPKQVWDTRANLIKPLAILAVLYVPLVFALFAFNLMGYDDAQWVIIDGKRHLWDDFSSAALTGRVRLLVLGSVFCLWAALPILAVLKHLKKNED